MSLSEPLFPSAHPVERIWGGNRLASPHASSPIGELWIIDGNRPVQSGTWKGRTITDLAVSFPEALLGQGRDPSGFPLLIKLLDCADWLSVQVHPDDEAARRLEGPGLLGKTEAWHILEAAPGAQIIAGLQEDLELTALQDAIAQGQVMNHVVYQEVRTGDSVMIPAGTVHALGPGLLLYEVQQASDLTYRIHDWDRPATAGRSLHLSQSAQVARPHIARPQPHTLPEETGLRELLRCEYFVLEELRSLGNAPIQQFTDGQSFHAITLTKGQATLELGGKAHTLGIYDSVLIPAAAPPYQLSGNFTALLSRLP